MKILVKKVQNEFKKGSGRCSDGWHVDVNYENTVKIFSDSEKIKLSLSKVIIDFINSHTSSYDDREFGGWSGDKSFENFNMDLAIEFKSALKDEYVEISELDEECPYLLNSIAKKIIESHRLAISELKNKHSIIYQNYLTDLDISKAEIARKTFYSNECIYDTNELIPDFNEFPLDIARQCNDPEFLDYLISKGATSVKDSLIFLLWLCEKGKFEYIELFTSFEKIKLKASSYVHNNEYYKDYGYGDKLTITYLLNTIAYNKPELFFKYGKLPNGKYPLRLCENKHSEGFSISIGQFALSKSSNETIKTLADYDKEFFYSSKELAEGCFKDNELADLFLRKAPTDSLYTLFKAGRIELIKELIEMNCFDFSEVELSKFRPFFKPENNYIIKYLAFQTSKPLTKRGYKQFYSYGEDEFVDSVIEQYIQLKNFLFAKQLFDISNTKEKVSSSDACRILFILFKNDDKFEAIEFKRVLLGFISEEDLFSLMIISWMEKNEQLFIFLIPLIKDINTPINQNNYKTFGIKISNSIIETFKNNKDGSFLHLIAASGIHFSHEHLQKLLNAGIDKTIKNSEGKVAYDCISFRGFGDSLIYYLQEMLYIEGCKICYPDGTLMSNSNLPVVKKFKNYTEKGINAVTAYKTNNKEALDFFISCGAEINRLKAEVESEVKRKKSKNLSQHTEFIDTSPTQKELDDMYRDAFDGFDDAVWNID